MLKDTVVAHAAGRGALLLAMGADRTPIPGEVVQRLAAGLARL